MGARLEKHWEIECDYCTNYFAGRSHETKATVEDLARGNGYTKTKGKWACRYCRDSATPQKG